MQATTSRGLRQSWRPLLECYGWVRIVPVDDRAVVHGSFCERVLAIEAFWVKVFGTRYDLCATLYYDRRYQLITLPLRARRKLAFSGRSRAESLIPGCQGTDEYGRALLVAGRLPATQRHPGPPDTLPPSPLPIALAERRIMLAPGGTSNLMGEQVLRRWPSCYSAGGSLY